MAFVTADRVLDTSTSTGTGAIVVAASPPTGYRTFSAVLSVSDTFYYSIQHQSLNEYEVGLGTYTSANTFSRTTIYTSSNAGSAVSFSAGTKNVFITMVASRTPQLDAAGNLTPATGTYTRTTITATGGQTSFTANYTVNYAEVFVNGILLNSADYTATSGTTVVLASAASAGDIIDVVALNVGTFAGGVTITGTPASGQLASWTGSTSLQGVESFPVWQSVQTGNFTAVVGRAYPVNTTSGVITVTLPASPTFGQIVRLGDYAGTWTTNNVTVSPNGGKINGATSDTVLFKQRGSVDFIWLDSTQGWEQFSAVVTGTYLATYLIVGGGGAGSYGGGGAGGFQTSTVVLTSGTTYSATVGVGGSGAAAGSRGTSGGDSVFNGITSTGGGAGGAYSTSLQNALSGGSGGGGGSSSVSPYPPGTVGSGTSGQGNAGGLAVATGGNASGGGGGATAVGGAASAAVGGNGGAGTASSITGSSVTYAGGGGGAGATTRGTGGAGGGGAGAQNTGSLASVAGTANTGGGGGGTFNTTSSNGGSGVVILAVPSINYSGVVTGSPTVTTSGSNTIITFTASGSYTA